jgi:hypothetical protein
MGNRSHEAPTGALDVIDRSVGKSKHPVLRFDSFSTVSADLPDLMGLRPTDWQAPRLLIWLFLRHLQQAYQSRIND